MMRSSLTPAFAFALAVVQVGTPTTREQRRTVPVLMIVAPATACRAEADPSARVVRSYRLGDIIDVARDTARGGATWHATESTYSGPHPLCWIADNMTTPFDRMAPTAALDTLTRRALQPENHWRFEDLVAVENLLIGSYPLELQRSGLLQYRRLLIVDKANAARDVPAQNPLDVAWVLAHHDFLAQDPFAAESYSLAKPYWDLYERFQNAPWADELAWKAAQLREPTDECYAECVLTAGIINGPMQYWIRRPNGHSIAAALDDATKLAKYADDMACFDRKQAAVSKSESLVPAALVDSIRASLSRVTTDKKRQLLDYLAEAEAKCR